MSWLKNAEIENRLEKLFDEYVPSSGASKTVGGEIIRAVSRIGYRYFNDGDKIGMDSGNETCNCAGRYLKTVGFENEVALIWNGEVDNNFAFSDEYKERLNTFVEKCLEKLESNHDLFKTENHDDMLNYRRDEDWDYYDDDEDEDF